MIVTIQPALRAVLFSLSIAFTAGAGSVTVSLKCAAESPCPLPAAITARSVSDPAVVRRLAVTSAEVSIAEAAASEWDVVIDAKGYWSLPLRIAVPAADVERRETLVIWRTGTVRLSVKPADPRLSGVRIVAAAPPDPRKRPDIPRSTSFACTGVDSGVWNCEVPAVKLDLAIRPEGYAAHYIWDATTPVNGVLNVGEIPLRKGGSVVAWLDSGFAQQTSKPVRAILRHHVVAGVSATTARLASPVSEATFNKKGVVHLSPLPAGRYVLEAVSEGYAPGRFHVEVFEGRESSLRRIIELVPATVARFRITPPLTPAGTPWTVELWRRTDFGAGSERAGGGAASQEGVFVAKDQHEGTVRLLVKDAQQNTLANREVAISGPDAEIVVSLEIVSASGIVRLGDEPLPRALLWFGGTSGAEKVRVSSGEDGRFRVQLPRAGKWRVDVELKENGISGTADVTVADKADDLDVVLPANEVAGSVKDSGGERLASAEVTLLAGSTPLRSSTAEDGTFRFRGVPAGEVSLFATDRRTGEDSRMVGVNVPAKGVVQNVELLIEAAATLKGLVRSGGAAVVGARVVGYAFVGGAAQQKRATTDLQGRFTFEVPEGASEVTLVVGSPGRTLHAFAVPNTRDTITLDLAPRGGELHLRWSADAQPLRVLYNDKMIPVPDLWEWARANGRSVESGIAVIPELAAGRYQFCAPARCVDGLLAVGGRLELDLNR